MTHRPYTHVGKLPKGAVQHPKYPDCWVSRAGMVFSTKRYKDRPIVLSQAPGEDGNMTVSVPMPYVHKDGEMPSTTRAVHILVLETFHGPKEEGKVARHKNGNQLDNRAANLEWSTWAEIGAGRARAGRSAKGEDHGRVKLTEGNVRTIRRRLAEGVPQQALADFFGVSRKAIYQIKTSKNWGWLK